jgi:hypothetical protein
VTFASSQNIKGLLLLVLLHLFPAAVLQLVLKDVLLYPNSVSVPLMTNFGVPPEPQGMVKVTLTKIENLKTTDLLTKGDPYVVFEVRGRGCSMHGGVVFDCGLC